MKHPRLWAIALVVCVALISPASAAPAVYPSTTQLPPNATVPMVQRPDGSWVPQQGDINGQLLTSGAGGGGGGTVTQGTPADPSAAWPEYIVVGGVAVSVSNKFPMSDVSLDALISGGSLPVSLASVPLPSGAATLAEQQVINATLGAPFQAGGSIGNTTFASTQSGTWTVGINTAIPAGTNNIGYVTTLPIGTTGLAPVKYINAAASAMATSISTGSHNVYDFQVCNVGTGIVYFRMFNLATAPTVGTSTPAKTIPIFASSCQTIPYTFGVTFGTGLAFDVTSGSMADNDTTTITTANTVVVNIDYK